MDTLREALESSVGTLSNETEVKTEETTPETVEENKEPETDVTEEAPKVPEEVKEEVPEVKDDSFTSVDPKTLSPELQLIYKSLQADYTKKTQLLAQEKKAMESAKSEKTVDEPQAEKEVSKMTLEEYVAYTETKAREAVKDEHEESLKRQAQQDFNGLDSRLNIKDTNTYDPIVDAYVSSKLDESVSEYIEKNGTFEGFDYRDEAKKKLEEWDNYMGKQINTYLTKQKQLAQTANQKSSTKTPTSKSGSTKSMGLGLTDSIRAAYEEAKR